MAKIKGPCMTPECARTESTRGLCVCCYSAARAAVASKKTTWDELVRMGLARDSAPRGQTHGPFMERFTKAKKGGAA